MQTTWGGEQPFFSFEFGFTSTLLLPQSFSLVIIIVLCNGFGHPFPSIYHPKNLYIIQQGQCTERHCRFYFRVWWIFFIFSRYCKPPPSLKWLSTSSKVVLIDLLLKRSVSCWRFSSSTSSTLKTDIQLFRFVFSSQEVACSQVFSHSFQYNHSHWYWGGVNSLLMDIGPGLPRHGAGLSCAYTSRDLLLCTLRCKVSQSFTASLLCPGGMGGWAGNLHPRPGNLE